MVKLWFKAVLFALISAAPLHAQSPCRLALVLALDVSSSVDNEEYDLQRKGLAAALGSKDVRHAILNNASGHVSLLIYEWSGRNQQKIVLDWTALENDAAIFQAAAKVASTQRSFSKYPTSMGYSLGFGAGLLRDGPNCARSVIDVSGDGINNDGFTPSIAYRHFPFKDVTVNGLVITGSDPDVLWFYESEVLRGPQAFVEIANGFADFERTMIAKLFREISDVMIGELAPSSEVEPKRRPRS